LLAISPKNKRINRRRTSKRTRKKSRSIEFLSLKPL